MTRFALPAVLLCCSIWLLQDSCSFGLMPADPDTGRERGCYTQVELALGLKSPSVIRYVEGSVALLLPLAALIVRRRQVR